MPTDRLIFHKLQMFRREHGSGCVNNKGATFSFKYYPTGSFTILLPRDQEIVKFTLVQESRAIYFEVVKKSRLGKA